MRISASVSHSQLRADRVTRSKRSSAARARASTPANRARCRTASVASPATASASTTRTMAKPGITMTLPALAEITSKSLMLPPGAQLIGRSTIRRGRRAGARPERALHQYDVDPAAELEAGALEHEGLAEAERAVERDRAGVAAVA